MLNISKENMTIAFDDDLPQWKYTAVPTPAGIQELSSYPFLRTTSGL